MKLEAKPFLKWAGGKRQLLKHLLARFPSTFNRYFEPFLGGGAVFFGLAPKKAILSDINPELIECYQVIKNQLQALVDELKTYPKNSEFYYRLRGKDVKKLTPIERSARLIYLNRLCYNGLYRVNKQGLFNVPYGAYTNPNICNEPNLQAVAQILKQATLLNTDVFHLQKRIRAFDLVYLDPPYHPLNKTSQFKNYTQFRFNEVEQEKLAEVFQQLAARKAYVVLSNSDTPFIRKLYRGFNIETVEARRAINSQKNKRGTVKELIVRSWD